MAGILSVNLDKPIIVVRKGESCHGAEVELPSMCQDGTSFTEQPRRYIIIDDGISMGGTICNILQKIKEDVDIYNTSFNANFDLLPVGIFCYNQDRIGSMSKETVTGMAKGLNWPCLIVGNNQLLYNP